jgi:glucose-6-phosphate 1-epimerase
VTSTRSPGEDALVVLRNAAGDEATVSLHGAQVLSWRPAGAHEQIYLSPLSQPGPGVAVRGGIPVCFPQFSERGPLPKHGFARTRRWELVAPPSARAEVAEARLQLDSSMTRTIWDHAFCLVLVVRVGPKWLEVQLQAANTGRNAWTFTGALHTYLRVADVRNARVLGLKGLACEDMVRGNAVHIEQADALVIAGEVDRVYRGVTQPVRLTGLGSPDLRVVQQGFQDTVVWNPGPDKAARLGDLPPPDWQHMLCIEAALVHRPMEVAPGKTWRGLQRLELPQAPGFDPAQASA